MGARARALVELAGGPASALERAWLNRTRRLAAALVVGLFLFGLGLSAWRKFMEPMDLARGHPWRTSTKLADCSPVKGECANTRTTVLFHTDEEESPWFEIDLEAPKTFSSLTIVNRYDSMLERAVPLVVEVSDDGQAFRPVARRDDVFEEWRPRFDTQTARYVRLRVDRKSWLHLEAVRVHP
jgi:hypothetical protein